MKVDWEKLDAEGLKYTGTTSAKEAFEKILGEEGIQEAVRYGISFKPGWDLAMGCLRDIESKRATEIAYEIYKTSPDEKEREMAIYLIREIAHPCTIIWIEEFLNDPKTSARIMTLSGCAITLLEHLVWRGKEAEIEQIKYLLKIAQAHPSAHVSERATILLEELLADGEIKN